MGVFEWPRVRGRDVRRRARARRLRRLHRRRRRRLGARRARGGRRRPHLVDLDRAAARRSSCSKGRSFPGVAAIPAMSADRRQLEDVQGAGRGRRVLPRAARRRPPGDVDVVVCPPYVSLADAVQALAGTEIGVFAQNCHWDAEGAFTGEISRADAAGARRLRHARRPLGAPAVLRRDRRDGRAPRRAPRSRQGLHVIACVGETEAEREAGETDDVLRRQLAVLEPDDNLVIAYEPVWAIGTGKTATPEMAQEAHETIKSLLDVPVLYGGSVKPDNAAELLVAAGDRRRARRRRLARRRLVRRDMPFGARNARHPRRLRLRAARPRQRGRARRHAGLRPALARRSRTRRSKRRARRPACRPGRWATARSAT